MQQFLFEDDDGSQGVVSAHFYGRNTSLVVVHDADRDAVQFYEEDIPKLIRALQQAHDYIQQQKEKK
jgi:hypothetical protein